MICPGGIWHGGLLSGGICPGGICPGGICPRTAINIGQTWSCYTTDNHKLYDIIFNDMTEL